MSTWAPNTKNVIDKGFGRSRNGTAVVGAITHHVAGKDGKNYVANDNNRNSHPTYHIANDGTVTGIVHPNRRPTSTGGSIDESCITVEIDNEQVGGDWKISDAALNAWAVVIRHHADESPRRGKAIEVNDPKNKQAGFFVGMHHQYVSTACPGPYVTRNIGNIVAKANGGQGSAPAAPSKPAPSAPASKSISQLADEVLAGKHGTGDARKRALGGNYNAVQDEINRRLKTPSAPAPAPSAPSGGRRELRVGVVNGSDIGRLQRFLKANYPAYARHIAVDDNYGNQMAGVIKEFQRRSGIASDGVVGLKQTWPALNRAGFSG